MSTPWIVAVLILWGLTVVLAVTVLGVLRRIGPVLERTETLLATGRPAVGGAPPGTTVPPFEVKDENGALVASSEIFSSPALVLFMSSICEPCRSLAADMSGFEGQVEGVPLFIVMEDSEEARRFPLPRSAAVLYQADQSASKAFQNISTPQVFLVEEGGIVIDLLVPGSLDGIRRHVVEHMKGGGRRNLRRHEVVV